MVAENPQEGTRTGQPYVCKTITVIQDIQWNTIGWYFKNLEAHSAIKKNLFVDNERSFFWLSFIGHNTHIKMVNFLLAFFLEG